MATRLALKFIKKSRDECLNITWVGSEGVSAPQNREDLDLERP